MRTIIDLPEYQITALREIEERRNVSRAELIRPAVAQYLVVHAKDDDAFGAWKRGRQNPDGLVLQKKHRAEWGR